MTLEAEMRKVLLALLPLVTSLSGEAQAVEIHLTADPSGTMTTLEVSDSYVPFDVYLVADGFGAGETFLGFEVGVDFGSFQYAGGVVLGQTLGGSSWLNIGGGTGNLIVGTAGPVSGEPLLLATLSLLPAGPTYWFNDVLISLGPSSPSDVGGMGPALLNAEGEIELFSFASNLLLNPVDLPAPPLHESTDGTPVPEPSILGLIGLGLVALGFARGRRAN
jgi:hypothetical protein